MADKTIGELPAASEVYDDSLLVMEQQGEARSVQGALIKKYAREATAAYVEAAQKSAEAARKSEDAAAESARDAADVALHPPTLKDENDHWWIWDTGLNDYKDSGIDAGVSLEVAEEVIVGEPGSGASVKNLGTKTDPNLQFTVEKGEKGDKGDAATIEVGEVTTGEPGEAASVKNSGTPGAAKLDFVIPKGDTGRGFTILGYYDTAEALEEAVQEPSVGDAYGVGTEKPYDIYIYDADKGWVDNGPIGGVPELPQHLVVADGDEVPATVATLHDHDTGEAIAPRTVVQALSGEGSEGDYVGFTADNQIGVIKKGAWPCNPSILDNWYLVGGGSQKGNSTFPINQQNQTEYTTNGYCIDRWGLSDVSMQIKDDCIHVEAQADNLAHWFGQTVENSRVVFGNKYTVSVLYKGVDGETYLASGTFVMNDVVALSISMPFSDNMSAYVDKRAGLGQFSIGFRIDRIAWSVDLIAMKLELGDTQTLAHKEGDKWVINEIPNYATELMKCKRYMQVYNRYFGTLISAIETSSGTGWDNFQVVIPEMRANPTVKNQNALQIREWGAGGPMAGETTFDFSGTTRMQLGIQARNSNILGTKRYALGNWGNRADYFLILDANL